ncbi:type II secretion system protein GspL [Desulfofustis limnaeus]|uniref:GspL periplasmic domain-containing protein n=1 Tax=Desulfofustis limnaeus TaxID=2740163 RepID=A0ABM7W716_9BACT|nr:type II secretion system protein GspL [Desulfofustis limnaeus]BDD86652.1 hypothetical protein DPPLL_10170 [Desulfofustis limnaeus]
MAEASILALAINGDGVAGIRFSESKRGLVLAAAQWQPIDGDQTAEAALSAVVERCRSKGCRCLVSLDSGLCTFRMLQLPFGDRKKVRSVLPFELEDNLSFAGDPYVFDALIEAADQGGSDVVAAVIPKETLRLWLDLLQAHDLDPELVSVTGIPAALALCRHHRQAPDDSVLLQLGRQRSLLLLVRQRTIRAVRLLPGVGDERATAPEALRERLQQLGVETGNTLLALSWPMAAGRGPALGLSGPPQLLDVGRQILADHLQAKWFDPSLHAQVVMDSRELLDGPWPPGALDHALALAVCPPRDRERLNFRQGEFAWHGGGALRRPLRIAAVAALLLVLGLMVQQVFVFQSMRRERDQLHEQMVALYRETVPEAAPGPDPLRDLQVRVNELQETATIGLGHDPEINVMVLLADISERLSATLPVSFERFVYDRKTIRIRGLTDTFNTVDQMKQALEQSPFFAEVSIGSANIAQQEQQVRFELRLDIVL